MTAIKMLYQKHHAQEVLQVNLPQFKERDHFKSTIFKLANEEKEILLIKL